MVQPNEAPIEAPSSQNSGYAPPDEMVQPIVHLWHDVERGPDASEVFNALMNMVQPNEAPIEAPSSKNSGHAPPDEMVQSRGHLWHDVDIGPDAPEVFNVVIEISKGDNVKFELDKLTGKIKVDRCHFPSIVYPHNYGFIPRTICEDHGPMGALVIMQEPIIPGIILRAKAIGLMRIIDQAEKDDKIIAVCADDEPVYRDVKDLPPHCFDEIRCFFEDYKKSKHKKDAVDYLLPRSDAIEAVRQSMDPYGAYIEENCDNYLNWKVIGGG